MNASAYRPSMNADAYRPSMNASHFRPSVNERTTSSYKPSNMNDESREELHSTNVSRNFIKP